MAIPCVSPDAPPLMQHGAQGTPSGAPTRLPGWLDEKKPLATYLFTSPAAYAGIIRADQLGIRARGAARTTCYAPDPTTCHRAAGLPTSIE
jgi:hypothetical protein